MTTAVADPLMTASLGTKTGHVTSTSFQEFVNSAESAYSNAPVKYTVARLTPTESRARNRISTRSPGDTDPLGPRNQTTCGETESTMGAGVVGSVAVSAPQPLSPSAAQSDRRAERDREALDMA